MQVVSKLVRFIIAVRDMPKAREFYSGTLGLKVVQDYRQDDNHWWVSLVPPEGAVTIALTTYHEHMKPGTMTLYFATSDLSAAHQDLSAKGVRVNEIKNDLYGPGSGVKWFSLEDPDGNRVHLLQA